MAELGDRVAYVALLMMGREVSLRRRAVILRPEIDMFGNPVLRNISESIHFVATGPSDAVAWFDRRKGGEPFCISMRDV